MADGTTTYGDVNQRTTALAPGAKRSALKKATMGKARAAKSRASAAEKAGRMTDVVEDRIDAKADRVLGRGKPTKRGML